MRKRIAIIVLMLMASVTVFAPSAYAIDWNKYSLDSIATWGKFPRFCVNTYHWGDKFFNGYDTTYVKGTGYKFNVKLKTDSWLEYNTFRFDDNRYQMNMVSYPSTSAGVWLQYMAVSAGYDVNVSKMLNLTHSSRKRWSFSFNCMLFAADAFLQNQDSRMRINKFGPTHHMHRTDVPYNGLSSRTWGINTYYFFNHKHYSQAAAFSYGRLQQRSSGSLYAGLAFTGQLYDFDFSELPQTILDRIPTSWPDYRYHIRAHNYAFKVGYGYNIVLNRHFLIGLSEAPSIGVRYGYNNNPNDKHTTLYAFNCFRGSVIWNNGPWFAGIIGRIDTDMFSEHDHTLLTNMFSLEASLGYRFNLW